MRRALLPLVLAAFVSAPAAAHAAEPTGPVVDVVEIAGVVDRLIERYAIERIDAAERAGVTLLVFEMNSLGGVKISDKGPMPPILQRIQNARIPIAVWVGPRGARAGGVATYMAAAAHIAAIGPSASIGPGMPIDFAHPDIANSDVLGELFEGLAMARGRTVRPERRDVYDADAALRAGFVDLKVPSVAELLRKVDGRSVQTSGGSVTLRLPDKETTIRFYQPGPIRRFLHAFANPSLVYLCLISAVLLLVFELFQPGFGVAGGTAALLFAGGGYGLSVLPARAEGLIALGIGLGLLTFDVARDEIFIPTFAGMGGFVAGSLMLLPGGSEAVRVSPWLVGFTSAAVLIFFIPVMTVVRRARKPIAPETRARLVGGRGLVRSVLNPEGFVWVEDELWRARSEDGARMIVGEPVVVASVDGSLLIVRAATSGNGSGA